MAEINLENLLDQFEAAKAAEDAAGKKKREIASLIAGALEHPDEGSKTHKVGSRKVTIKSVIYRRVDWEVWDELEHGEHPPVKIKRVLDERGLKWIRKNDPEYARRLEAAIIETPGAPGITIKEA